MSRLAAVNSRPPLRKPLPKWKIIFKLSLFGALAIALLLGWFSYSGLLEETHNALVRRYERYQIALGLQIKKIVINGRHVIPQSDILKTLEVRLGDPFSRFDMELAYSQLSQHPWVKSVLIQRQWPDAIHVTVHERVPLALWQYHQKVVLVDETGEVLTPHIESYRHFPLVIGPGAPQAAQALLQVLKNHPTLQQEVVAATRIGQRRWDLRLKNGITLMLPEENYEQSLQTIEGLQKKIQIFEKAKKVIDLRLPKKMVMR
jgi:cell division protein FtsQ